MTSPGVGKPESTNDKYADVHSRGSSFGADLSAGWGNEKESEERVRKLLMTEVRSPFGQFLQDGVNFVSGLFQDIADAISGKGGARAEVISSAVAGRLDPLDSAITETRDLHDQLADEVARSRAEVQDVVISQDKLVTQMDEVSPAAQAALEAAEAAGKLASDLSDDMAIAARRSGTNGSLLEFIDLTSEEVAAGKNAPYIKAWTTAGWVDSHSKFKDYKVWLGPLENKVADAKRVYASVVKNQPYLVRFWAKAGVPGTKLNMAFWPDKGLGGIIRVEKVAKGRNLDGSVEYYPEATSTGFNFIKNIVLNTEWTEYRSIVYFSDAVDSVAVHRTTWTPNPNNDPDPLHRQYIAGFEVSPYAPSQADVDNAQNLAIQANRELATQALQLATLNAEFNKEQDKLNELIQRQIDIQSDMLELQKIQALRRYSWKAETGTTAANPYTDDGSTSMHNADLFRCWDYRRKFVFAAKGRWEGSVKIGLNWTNGAYDEYEFTLDSEAPRAISTWGGTLTIHIRRITIEILVTNLRRAYTFTEVSESVSSDGVLRSGEYNLIRTMAYTKEPDGVPKYIYRFKTPVDIVQASPGATVPQLDLDRSVVHEASKGDTLPGYDFKITKEIINKFGGTLTFEEAWDADDPYKQLYLKVPGTGNFKDLGEA